MYICIIISDLNFRNYLISAKLLLYNSTARNRISEYKNNVIQKIVNLFANKTAWYDNAIYVHVCHPLSEKPPATATY